MRIQEIKISGPDQSSIDDLGVLFLVTNTEDNLDDSPKIVKRSGKWLVLDRHNNLIKTLSKKPALTPLTVDKVPGTNEKHRYLTYDRALFARSNVSYCQECHKTYWPYLAWLLLFMKLRVKYPYTRFMNSDGDIDFNLIHPGPHGPIVVTPDEFKFREYCSETCYKKARKKRQNERREKSRLKKYATLPDDERPDGYCKICRKPLTGKRAGSLTCCSAHRQALKRLKSKHCHHRVSIKDLERRPIRTATANSPG